MKDNHQGKIFKEAVAFHSPLVIVGVINAYCSLLAERAGFKALYLSGASVANASLGVPDIGISQLDDVLIDAKRICNASELPLLVDIDTGWEKEGIGIANSVKALEAVGVAAVQFEDQVSEKKCGHLPGKQLVSLQHMQQRIEQAVDARNHQDFVIMARTDAFSVEGFDAAVERSLAYVASGADMIFIEALPNLDLYRDFTKQIHVPVLANMTEFGLTPVCSQNAFADVGIDMVLYPLSAFRAMNHVASEVYHAIYHHGSQEALISKMETREELYKTLRYEHDLPNTNE